MCGIAAILRQNRRVEQHEISAMTDALAHRGPDGAGAKMWDRIGLGHRRLSIIDLETGSQPMCNEDASVWISFNGEIYNFRSLRSELEQHGHQFKTQSDTEVIIHAYEQWGKDCVKKFRGMFAFCVVDEKKQQLFLARDHFGIKPLYYFNWGGCFASASELRALRVLDEFPMALDITALDQYLWLQYIPAPRTIFTRVSKLPPAHYVTVSFDGKVSEPVQYWDTTFQPDHSKTENQWLEEVDTVLRESVDTHLVSDVPFGTFLSGGVDSSMITTYMSELLSEPVKTFSIGFEEEQFNELPYARAVASKLGTQHHEQLVHPDALGILPDLVSHYGEPFGDSSAIPMYYVSQLAREHVPMVLSGDGGDEAFAGYNRYLGWMGRHERTPQGWFDFVQYLSSDWRKSLWRSEYHHLMNERLSLFEEAFSDASNMTPSHCVQHVDRKTYLPFDILSKVDTASMMHGLEVRTPYIDMDVWELASRIPEEFNMRQDSNGQWEGKMLLKKLMGRAFPQNLAHRKKTGFAIPMEKWFASEGAYRDIIEERLLLSDSPLSEYFELSTIRLLLAENYTGPLWLLLFLDEWLQQYQEVVPTFKHSQALELVS